jgi:hypothetical protein
MKYTDQTSKTVYTDIEVEVKNGVTYFHTWDGDNEPEDYYKLNIKKDLRFDTLYDMSITKIRNYDTLPFGLRGYFSGQEKMEIITEEEFNSVKQEILNKL